MMYHVDMEGNVNFEKLNLQEERLDLLQNPLLGPYLRRKKELLEDEIMLERANKIAIYYLNKDKKFDLDNYLLWKAVNPMDLIRALWFKLSIFVGYADTYRNEQYLPRSDFKYNHDRKMLNINLDNPDREQLSINILTALSFELLQVANFFENKLPAPKYRIKVNENES